MKQKKDKGIMKHTELYNEAAKRYRELLNIREERAEQLSKAPQGVIRISNSGRRPQFYLKKDKSEKNWIYISKDEEGMLKQYVQKSYDEKVLKLLDQEIQAVDRFLKSSDGILNRIQQAYSEKPDEIQKYINPVDMEDDDYIKAWESIVYEGKGITDYVKFYMTDRKERVRSKSELIIANTLAANGIPYKYECPLVLKNGVKLYPDFTVLNMKERKEMYWEHRGMMDDKEYAKDSVTRIKMYMNNGIFVGKDLIITEETSASPLGTNEIEAILHGFF